jgi:FAD/FMN-containing dehydrogenase
MGSACKKFSLALTIIHLQLSLTAQNSPPSEPKPRTSLSILQENDLSQLNDQLQGRLIVIDSAYTYKYFGKDQLKGVESQHIIYNPFLLEDLPGATQSLGWLGAWNSSISSIGVFAKTKEDISRAVKFAKKHNLNIVIKGAGHDYLGRSNAKDSLLIWTHGLKDITVMEKFVPENSPKDFIPLQAVTVGAGARWLEVYSEVTTKNNLYVQGGGCTSVGAAGGFTLGGGFGSFSRVYGTGAGNLLEVEVVVANGDIVLANEFQNSDLFWAIKGGGGYFGIVTKMTYKLHPLPSYLGSFSGSIRAKDELAFQRLIESFVFFYQSQLSNPNWGESISLKPDNVLELHMMYINIDEQKVEATFKPFFEELTQKYPQSYEISTKLTPITPSKIWAHDPVLNEKIKFITLDDRINVPKDQFWWTNNSNQISIYWYTYQSRWLPKKLFADDQSKLLAETLFKASKLTPNGLEIHFNKGLASASPWAMESTKNTAMNPEVLKAAALVIIADGKKGLKENDKEFKVDSENAKNSIKSINEAMKLIKDISPKAGTYINEADYFLTDWQEEFFGENYQKLQEIKTKWDPDNFFKAHFSVEPLSK